MHFLNWRKINDFIEVSENGDVKSHGRIIKGEICKNGYRRVHVSDQNIDSKFLVHRLVAEAFIENPNNKPCVNHIDGNKLNNNVNNLEWVTYGENLSHAYKNNLRNYNGINNPMSKLTNEDVENIRSLYIKGKHSKYNSRGLSKMYGVSTKCILDVVNYRTYTDRLFREEREAREK